MPEPHVIMLAFRDELRKEGAPVMLQAARQILGRAVPAVQRVAGRVVSRVRGAGQAVARSAQRQRHGVTGYVPKEMVERYGMKGGREAYLKQIKGGKFDAAERLAGAKKALQDLGPQADPSAIVKAQKDLATARKSYGAVSRAQQMGLTSVPGYLRSVRQSGLGKTLKADIAQQWREGGMLGKAMIGLPLAGATKEMVTPTREGGPGKGKRVAQQLSYLAYGVGGALPILPQMAAGMLAGGAAAKGVDIASRLKRTKPPLGEKPLPPAPESEGTTQPAERIMTPAAMGQPPGNLAV